MPKMLQNVRSAKLISLGYCEFTRCLEQRIAVKTGLNLSRPNRIAAVPTMRCNLRCKQCDIWKLELQDPELNTSQWKRILLSLRRWLGVFRVNFSGGDPFLRRDLIDLLSFCSKNSILAGVVTNGFTIDQELSNKIMRCAPFNINVSLDGSRAQTHDYLRGVTGVYDRAVSAINYLKKACEKYKSMTRLIIKTTIMEPNLGELLDLVRYVEENRLAGILFEPLEQNLWALPDLVWFKRSPLWPKDTARVCQVLEALLDAKKRGCPILNSYAHLRNMKDYFANLRNFRRAGRCDLGVTNFDIGYTGDVRFCDHMPIIGNVTISAPQDIWNSPLASHVRELVRKCNRPCLATCHIKRNLADLGRLTLNLFTKR